MKWLRWVAAAFAATGLSSFCAWGCAAKDLDVVVTIKPIHSLVAAVMAGAGEPRLLIEGATSEHTYALKPSDAKALNDADVVVRVSPALEVFLNRTLESLPRSVHVITLEAVPQLVTYDQRTGGTFEDASHSHRPAHGGHVHGSVDEAVRDGHIWLDPGNAKLIAGYLAQVFSEQQPERSGLFKSNAAALSSRLDKLSDEIEGTLRPLNRARYVVFHDAYQYLERRYGLSPVGSVTISPELPTSARRLSLLRAKLKETGAVCVFAEPQFEPRLVQTLLEGTNARSGTLDPLGAAVPAGADLYFIVMRGLAQELRNCLQPRQAGQ
jgi:zinc transport system substrate-binding protein